MYAYNVNVALGNVLRKYREGRGFTQDEFATYQLEPQDFLKRAHSGSPSSEGNSYSWSISWPERAGAPWEKQTLHYAGKTFMPHKSSETVEQKFCS